MKARSADAVLAALARSAFRAKFSIDGSDAVYLADRIPPVIRRQAREIIEKRLAPTQLENDGRQTPYRGHPVFVAQHATATCCRACLQKWHGVPTDRAMSPEEVDRTLDVICRWIEARRTPARQLDLALGDDSIG